MSLASVKLGRRSNVDGIVTGIAPWTREFVKSACVRRSSRRYVGGSGVGRAEGGMTRIEEGEDDDGEELAGFLPVDEVGRETVDDPLVGPGPVAVGPLRGQTMERTHVSLGSKQLSPPGMAKRSR